MYKIAVINPGHFHAALSFKEKNDKLSDDIYVYSKGGEELAAFMKIIESFNTRADNPTSWKVEVYEGDDYLEKALGNENFDIAILAGKNNTKMNEIQQLHAAGKNVIADKPWITDSVQLKDLESSLQGDQAIVMDMMTGRFDRIAMIQKELVALKDIFGELQVKEGKPSVYKQSIHHLYKMVNGAPLVRPAWYFDTEIQGEGIIDVTTHLVDMVQWMLSDQKSHELTLTNAKRWPTAVSLDKFKTITGKSEFPVNIQKNVSDNTLNYFCNGLFEYNHGDIPVEIEVVWNLEAPEGSGDTHKSIMTGSVSNIEVNQDASTNYAIELSVVPHEDGKEFENKLNQALENLIYKGLTTTKKGNAYVINVPEHLMISHEEQFSKVLNKFLNRIEQGTDQNYRNALFSKYKLLADAKDLALNQS